MPDPNNDNKPSYRLLCATELSRRGFLQSTGLAAGGLVVGLVAPAGCANQPAVSPAVATDLSAYIRISSDGEISIVVPGAELGQGVYTSLPKIVADELEADWDRVVVRLATADERFNNPGRGRQSTGNSDAVINYFDALRKTGAATRQMLISAAAQQWQVSTDSCRASQSLVHHDTSGKSLSYGALAEAAAQLPVPEDPPLKSRENYTLIGKSVPRKDNWAKVTGSAVFGADVRLPNQLFASIRTSPVFGGRLKPGQLDSHVKGPGVFKLIELEDGVAIAADSFWEANTALQALDLVFESETNASWDSERISGILTSALDGDTARPFPRAKGDATAAIAAAQDVFEATYEVPFLAHICMEPMTATAQVTDTQCKIWAPHQQQGAARAAAAEITGLPMEQVSLQGTFCGGGFGRKWELDFVRQAVQIAQQTEGRPVTLMWTREQDIGHDFYRPAAAVRSWATLDESGMPAAIRARVAGSSVMAFQGRPLPIPDPLLVSGAINSLYNIPNTLIEYAEVTTHVPVGFWRSVALSHNGFIGEGVIDELAHRAGKDPVEFRLAMLRDNPRARAVVEKAAREAGWGKTLGPNTAMGVAFSAGFGSFNAQVAQITVDGDTLSIDKVTCVHDCGFAVDPDTVRAQMEGGVIDGLSAALFGKITIAQGAVEQSNFHDYRFIKMNEVPQIQVHLISADEPLGGVGEAAVPAIGPAVVNGIFAATGRRLRRLPIVDAGFTIGQPSQEAEA